MLSAKRPQEVCRLGRTPLALPHYRRAADAVEVAGTVRRDDPVTMATRGGLSHTALGVRHFAYAMAGGEVRANTRQAMVKNLRHKKISLTKRPNLCLYS